MAKMTKNATTGNYELNITPGTSAQTKAIKTSGKYCNADIDVKVDAVPIFDWASVSSNWATSNGAVTNISEKFSIKSLIFTSSASANNSCRRLFANSETTYFIPLATSDTYIQLGTISGVTTSSPKYNLYNKGIVKIEVVNNSSTQTRTITMYYRSNITSTGWTQQATLSVSYTSGQPGVYVYNYSGTGKSIVAEIYYNA